MYTMELQKSPNLNYNLCKDSCTKSVSVSDNVEKCILKTESCKKIYNTKRVPSYCDRIIYKHTNSVQIDNNATFYDSNYSKTIEKSDHAITYFTTTLNSNPNMPKLKLLYITFNQAGKSYDYEDVVNLIKFSKVDVNQQNDYKIMYGGKYNYDVIILCQQETALKETLCNQFRDKLQNEYNYLQKKKGLPLTKFYVRLSVFIKKDIDIVNNSVKSECFNIVCTKSYIGIIVILKLEKRYTIKLNIFGTHLPVKTSVSDLGYAQRLKALIRMLKIINCSNYLNCFSIIGGDLNFRIDIDHHMDQLNLALSSEKLTDTELDKYFKKMVGPNFAKQIGYFKNWKEKAINFIPSCKINELIN